jgi:transcriptional antiterminator NusG
MGPFDHDRSEDEASDKFTSDIDRNGDDSAVVEKDSALAHQDSEHQLSDEERKQITDPRFKWFIVNTYSGSEDSVKLNLRERIVKAGLESSFGDIFIPKVVIEKVLKSGKKKMVDKTSFPGYIIVQMALNDQTMACVAATPKVTGFVGNRKSPRPLPDRDVLRLLNPKAYSDKMRAVASKVQFNKGQQVKVVDGPFTNFDGVVDEVRPDKMKLKVLVSIFGRETPVELGYNQVERIG